MFTPLEIIPTSELSNRQKRFRTLLKSKMPQAGGMLIFSRMNIYYFAGTYAIGILWLPVEGHPILLVRKGLERVKLESPNLTTALYRSYSDIQGILQNLGSPLSETIAVEESGLTWSFGLNLSKKLTNCNFVAGDHLLQRTRSLKSAWELDKIRKAGQKHYVAMCETLPTSMQVGMSEYEISRIIWDIFFQQGHSGAVRMSSMGEETFLGHVSAGDNSAYPSYYNGPLGVKGVHPCAAHMGDPKSFWLKKQILAIDVGFVWEGYHTDKTQLYFAGTRKDVPTQALSAQACALHIQQELASMLKPGAIPQELYKRSLAIAEDAGFAQGYMGIDGNKVPFVGHGIGLHVDEWPVLANNFTEPLEDGMVIALEPKITLPNLSPAIGMMGVENTFLVTKNGGQSLTTKTANLADDCGDIIFVG